MTTSNQESEFHLTPEEEAEIARHWREFAACQHDWVPEPEGSLFYSRCSKCGGAEGIRPLQDFWAE